MPLGVMAEVSMYAYIDTHTHTHIEMRYTHIAMRYTRAHCIEVQTPTHTLSCMEVALDGIAGLNERACMAFTH